MILRNWLMAGALLSLSACGFQLRSDFKPPASAMPLEIVAEKAPYLGVALKERLQDQGVELFNRRACRKNNKNNKKKDGKSETCVPQTRVYVRNENMQQRRLSISSLTQRMMEVELVYTLQLEIRNGFDEVLLAPRRLELQRDFTYDENAPLAMSAEAEYLRGELRAEMLATVLRTLRVVLQQP